MDYESFMVWLKKGEQRAPSLYKGPQTPGIPENVERAGNPGKEGKAGNVVRPVVPVAEPVRDWKAAASGDWDSVEDVEEGLN